MLLVTFESQGLAQASALFGTMFTKDSVLSFSLDRRCAGFLFLFFL